MITENAEGWPKKQKISPLSYRGRRQLVCCLGLICKAANCHIYQIWVTFPQSLFFLLRNGNVIFWKCFISSFPCSFTSQIPSGNCNSPIKLGICFISGKEMIMGLCGNPAFPVGVKLSDSSDGIKCQCHIVKIHRNFPRGWKKKINVDALHCSWINCHHITWWCRSSREVFTRGVP